MSEKYYVIEKILDLLEIKDHQEEKQLKGELDKLTEEAANTLQKHIQIMDNELQFYLKLDDED